MNLKNLGALEIKNKLAQITVDVQSEQPFYLLEQLAAAIPAFVYWKDLNSAYLGANVFALQYFGLELSAVIGKTDYDFWPEFAEKYIADDRYVIKTGKSITKEDLFPVPNNEVRYCVVTKSPLRNSDGTIIGVIGTSIDMTAAKKAKKLEAEIALQKIRLKLQEYKKFSKLAAQVAHDIRSPLASLQMVVKSCQHELSESVRIALRDAAMSIGDIADNLLGNYGKSDIDVLSTAEVQQPVLVSLALSQLLTDKRYQYQNLPIKFSVDFATDSSFVFVKADSVAFNRMLSNLLNNAVEAFSGQPGEVSLKLSVGDAQLQLVIQDNGNGIPPEVLEKIKNNVAVTSGKQDGHGIGLTQVREVLQQSNAGFAIESVIGAGTKIALTFPTISAPDWIAQEVRFRHGDTVVILDDDVSIHQAWEIRCKDYVDANIVKLQHFTSGAEAITFINTAVHSSLFLLADFELLQQELNGIDVIKVLAESACARELTGVSACQKENRAILVTSHYNNQMVRNLAAEVNTQILPKQLASDIPIKMIPPDKLPAAVESRNGSTDKRKVDMVLIEDNEILVKGLVAFLSFHHKVVDRYSSPQEFLQHLALYSKNTKIFTDYSFAGQINGMELAKQLHEVGYTQLYLFTGWNFPQDQLPDYLTVILKTDTDKLLQLI